jgi:bacillithiol system protein YtxJ
MSFFKNIFGNNDAVASKGFWKALETMDDLNNAIEESKTKKVVIFKHSTRCHISKMVLSKFENEVKNSENELSYYFLDLINHRDISNAIADQLEVTHQSPQLLVLENGIVVHHASHSEISLASV